MRPERLIYTYVSMAAQYDTDWGHGTPDEGVERTAATAHKYGIPVTWIVNSGSIKVLGDRIWRWHEKYGDDVILRCPSAGENARKHNQLVEAINSEWAALQAAFPWVTTKVAGAGMKDGRVIAALIEAGFEGMWGYCWEQVWWDGITNQGVPWGFWYVDKDRYKIPDPTGGQLVACEWTARDLHQSYHTASPVIYSTDPNDVLRAGLCSGTDIEYWKRLFQDYLRNTTCNDHVYFLQHQEAHEMEVTEAFAVYPFSHVTACDEMQDLFFQHITQYPITATTLPKAIRQYKEQHTQTAPCWMLTEDPMIRPEVNEYTMALGGVGAGPWPDTLFYYDKDCQLAFVKGENKPRMLRNYIGQWDMQQEFSEPSPQVFVTHYSKSAESIEIVYEIGHWKPIPYGLSYWDELGDYEVEASEGATSAVIIEDRLVFMRFNLTGYPMKIVLKLTRKTVPKK